MLISPEYQAELRNKYNPDGSDLRKLQLKLVEILKYIDEICQKAGISYWLAAGNVLGQERHGGFIPWDDDIDIEMRLEDYKRLRKAIINDKNSPYKWQDAKTDKYYLIPFAKIRDLKSEVNEPYTEFYEMRGIYIDVFVVEYSTHFMTKYSTRIRQKLMRINRFLSPNKSNKFLISLTKFFLHNIILPTWIFINKPFRSHKYLYYYPSSVCNDFNYFVKENIFPLKRIIFEGIEVSYPNNPQEYLKGIYGNWEEIPSQDKIHTHFDSNKIHFFE